MKIFILSSVQGSCKSIKQLLIFQFEPQGGLAEVATLRCYGFILLLWISNEIYLPDNWCTITRIYSVFRALSPQKDESIQESLLILVHTLEF